MHGESSRGGSGHKMLIDKTSDLLDDPQYFYCEGTHCKLKLDVCLGRQKANEQRVPFEPLRYGVCENCKQGIENRAMSGIDEVGQKQPSRGKGRKYDLCVSYDKCLDLAAARDWKSFNCESCETALQAWGVTMEGAEEKVNTRICEDCHKRATIRPSSPYCPPCMAKRANDSRKGKAKAALGEKAGTKGNGRGKAKKRSHGPISKPGFHEEESISQGIAVTVDFGGYPAILEEIERRALEEIRPIPLQILFMLKAQISAAGE